MGEPFAVAAVPAGPYWFGQVLPWSAELHAVAVVRSTVDVTVEVTYRVDVTVCVTVVVDGTSVRVAVIVVGVATVAVEVARKEMTVTVVVD